MNRAREKGVQEREREREREKGFLKKKKKKKRLVQVIWGEGFMMMMFVPGICFV
jgi:hypothetical protein